MDTDHEAVAGHLEDALQAILAAMAVTGLDTDDLDPPHDAFDQALGRDEDYQACRRVVRDSLRALLRRVPEDLREAVLDLEGTFTGREQAAMDVVWRLGVRAGRAAEVSGPTS